MNVESNQADTMDAKQGADHVNGNIFTSQAEHHSSEPLFPQIRIHPDYLPGGRRSLSGVALHAFGLGVVLGISMLLSIQLAYLDYYLWRLPFFISALSVFHYLEFDMTARYNPPDAKLSSFLLFSNGRAYNFAHTAAVTEILVRHFLVAHHTLAWRHPSNDALQAATLTGIVLVVIGQCMRSLAMRQAKTSFNHLVQSTKKEDHVLVTSGVYAISRHPAYFGFFWWGLGTQLVLGNYVCFVGYSIVLWKFFAHRIFHEEKHLTTFFGSAYLGYKKKTPVLIPFIG